MLWSSDEALQEGGGVGGNLVSSKLLVVRCLLKLQKVFGRSADEGNEHLLQLGSRLRDLFRHLQDFLGVGRKAQQLLDTRVGARELALHNDAGGDGCRLWARSTLASGRDLLLPGLLDALQLLDLAALLQYLRRSALQLVEKSPEELAKQRAMGGTGIFEGGQEKGFQKARAGRKVAHSHLLAGNHAFFGRRHNLFSHGLASLGRFPMAIA